MSRICWIASYPKSGNTWMRFMLTSYLRDAPVTQEEETEEAVPDFYKMLMSGTLAPRDAAGPALLKTHFLPSRDVMRYHGPLTGKVLYLVRNPRDVLLSCARQLKINPSEDERARKFAMRFIENRGEPSWIWRGMGTWPQNVRELSSLEDARQYYPETELRVVRYEDLRINPASVLAEIIESLDLGTPVDHERIKRAVDNCSLAKMRAIEESSRPDGEPEFAFIGKGLSNQPLAAFGKDVEAAYDRLLEEDDEFSHCAKQFGYDH